MTNNCLIYDQELVLRPANLSSQSRKFVFIILFCIVLLLQCLSPDSASADESAQSDSDLSAQVLNPSFSPDGDGFDDYGVLTLEMRTNGRVAIQVRDASKVVKTLWTGKDLLAGKYNVGWSGTDSTGRVLPNGKYIFTVSFVDSSGTHNATAAVDLLNVAPTFTQPSVMPNPVSPNADKMSDSTAIEYTLNSAALITIEIHNSLGNIRTLTSRVHRSKGTHREIWTGKDMLANPVKNGVYRAIMKAENRFGKTTLIKTIIVEGVVGGGPLSIQVDRSERSLYLKEGEFLLKRYPIAIGMSGWETPIGSYKIVRKDINPTWYPPKWAKEKAPVKYPRSPLGPRRLLLSDRSYGIHGTLSRAAIGRAATHGCIRLYNEDIKQLFDIVPSGTLVKIVP